MYEFSFAGHLQDSVSCWPSRAGFCRSGQVCLAPGGYLLFCCCFDPKKGRDAGYVMCVRAGVAQQTLQAAECDCDFSGTAVVGSSALSRGTGKRARISPNYAPESAHSEARRPWQPTCGGKLRAVENVAVNTMFVLHPGQVQARS